MRRIGAVLRGVLFGLSDAVLVLGVFTIFAFWLSRTVPMTDLIGFLLALDGNYDFAMAEGAESALVADQNFVNSVRQAAFMEGLVVASFLAMLSGVISVIFRCSLGLMAISIEDRVFARLSQMGVRVEVRNNEVRKDKNQV